MREMSPRSVYGRGWQDGDTPAAWITGILTLYVRLTIILDRKGASV